MNLTTQQGDSGNPHRHHRRHLRRYLHRAPLDQNRYPTQQENKMSRIMMRLAVTTNNTRTTLLNQAECSIYIPFDGMTGQVAYWLNHHFRELMRENGLSMPADLTFNPDTNQAIYEVKEGGAITYWLHPQIQGDRITTFCPVYFRGDATLELKWDLDPEWAYITKRIQRHVFGGR